MTNSEIRQRLDAEAGYPSRRAAGRNLSFDREEVQEQLRTGVAACAKLRRSLWEGQMPVAQFFRHLPIN